MLAGALVSPKYLIMASRPDNIVLFTHIAVDRLMKKEFNERSGIYQFMYLLLVRTFLMLDDKTEKHLKLKLDL
ncbi:hypothetical protein CRE_18294 [Caenorhabditis remanei]|uniref:Uncharacterized protein n=1 Tax=Caenorhabditis remanei TaxID=31234 RepID=E3NMM0_CAERE|nr:hypothetical protein CRE_18294 [Caenorhabditis remanei]